MHKTHIEIYCHIVREKLQVVDNQSFICTDTVASRRYFYEGTGQGTFFDATTQVEVHDFTYQLDRSIKEIIIIKLYAIIVCNIVRYCTQLI